MLYNIFHVFHQAGPSVYHFFIRHYLAPADRISRNKKALDRIAFDSILTGALLRHVSRHPCYRDRHVKHKWESIVCVEMPADNRPSCETFVPGACHKLWPASKTTESSALEAVARRCMQATTCDTQNDAAGWQGCRASPGCGATLPAVEPSVCVIATRCSLMQLCQTLNSGLPGRSLSDCLFCISMQAGVSFRFSRYASWTKAIGPRGRSQVTLQM